MLKNPNKILIFRLSSIGDIILTTALVRCLKNTFPKSKIGFVVKKQFADLLKHNPNIDLIVPFEKSMSLKNLRHLTKSFHTDWFIDIHNNIRSNLTKRFLGIPEKSGYSKKLFKRFLLVKLKINIYGNYKPVIERYFEAVAKYNVAYDKKGTDIFFSSEEEEKITDLLKSNNIKKGRFAVLCPGASFSNKQWGLDRFAEVANYLYMEKGLEVVLLGGPNDYDDCELISRHAKNNFLNVAGKLKLLESAALLKQACIAITNDSGMMHMAQSQKIPVAAIFGPTTSELGFFPLPEKSQAVETKLSCRPCTPKGLNHCPKQHFNCMNHISAKQVTNAIDKLLTINKD